MQKLILIVSLFSIFFSCNVFTQTNLYFPIDSITGKITFTDVVTVENTNADELFLKAKEWFVYNFQSATNVIQMEDKESGKIIGKGNFDVYVTSSTAKPNIGYVKFTVSIQVKDGRYKYIFSDILHDAGITSVYSPGDLRLDKPGGGLSSMGKRNWDDIKFQTKANIETMINSLEKLMASKNNSQDDW